MDQPCRNSTKQNQNEIRELNYILGDYLQFGVLLIHLEVVGLAGVDIDELLGGGIPLGLVIVFL